MVFLSSHPEDEHHEFVLMKGRDVPREGKLIQQVSFKVPSIDDLKEFHRRLKAENVQIQQIVSHGNALGMYFFDPEGNRIELYYKTGFPVPQPHGEPIDIEASNEELRTLHDGQNYDTIYHVAAPRSLTSPLHAKHPSPSV